METQTGAEFDFRLFCHLENHVDWHSLKGLMDTLWLEYDFVYRIAGLVLSVSAFVLDVLMIRSKDKVSKRW